MNYNKYFSQILAIYNLIIIKIENQYKKRRNNLRKYLKEAKNSVFLTIISLIISLAILSLIFIYPLNPNTESIDSMLTTVIQSLTSILAIVITLTLVAVQLSVQNYGDKISKIFMSKNNGYFWGLILLYIIIILFSLFLLNDKEMQTLLTDNIVISLFAYSLFLLLPYTINTVNKLKPEKIVNELSKCINKEFISLDLDKAILHVRTHRVKTKFEFDNFREYKDIIYHLDENPLVPINDIIMNLIKNNQVDMIKKCLEILFNQIQDLIDHNVLNKDNGPIFVFYIIYYTQKLERNAYLVLDSQTSELLITKLKEFTELNAEQFPDIHDLVLKVIENKSKDFTKEGMESAGHTLIDIILEKFPVLYKNAVLEHYNIKSSKYSLTWEIRTIKLLDCYNNLYQRSLKEDNKEICEHSDPYNILIIDTITKYGLKFVILNEIRFLREFGIDIIDNYLNSYPNQLISILHNFWLLYSGLFEEGHNSTIKLLSNEFKIDESQCFLDFRTYQLIQEGFRIFITSEMEITPEKVIIKIINSFKFLGLESIDKNKYNIKVGSSFEKSEIILDIIKYLEFIGVKCLSEKSFILSYCGNENESINKILNQVIICLGEIGLNLINKDPKLCSKILPPIYRISTNSEKVNQWIIDQKIVDQKVISQKVSLEALNQIDKIANELIKNNLSFLECTTYLKDVGLYGIKNELDEVINHSGDYLRELGVYGACNSTFINDTFEVVKYLEELTIKSIPISDEYIVFYFQNMKKIAEKFKECNSYIGYPLFDSIDRIQDELEKEGKKEIIKKIEDWKCNIIENNLHVTRSLTNKLLKSQGTEKNDVYNTLNTIFKLKIKKIRKNFFNQISIRTLKDEELAWISEHGIIEYDVTQEDLENKLNKLKDDIPSLRKKYSKYELWQYKEGDRVPYEKDIMNKDTFLIYHNVYITNATNDEELDKLFNEIISFISQPRKYSLKEDFVVGLSDSDKSEQRLIDVILNVEVKMGVDSAMLFKEIKELENKRDNIYQG